MRALRDRRVWLVAALGVCLACALGLLASSRVGPTAEVRVVRMASGPRTAHPAPLPAIAPSAAEAVYPPIAPSLADTLLLERMRDRADWIDGGVVTCDLSRFVPQDFEIGWEDGDGGLHPAAVVAPEQGLRQRGPVDAASKADSNGVFGRIAFVVREPEGTARVHLPVRTDAARGGRAVAGAHVELGWSGATPGSTVGCSFARRLEQGRLVVNLDFEEGDGQDPNAFVLFGEVAVTGCASLLRVGPGFERVVLDVPSGSCALRVERRNTTFPSIVTRGPPIAVEVIAGEARDVTLAVPPEPPFYQPPDLDEVATISDYVTYEVLDPATEWLLDGLLEGPDGRWVEDGAVP